MPDVIVIGDGPGGLSAALFLAKNKLDVVVFGQDKTAMNWALVRNYLGIPEIMGTEFQTIAREQVGGFGVTVRDEQVDDRRGGPAAASRHVRGRRQLRPRSTSCCRRARRRSSRSSSASCSTRRPASRPTRTRSRRVDGVYVVGRSSRPGRSQAIISAGDGAAAAIDILSREKDEDVVDWDEPPKA